MKENLDEIRFRVPVDIEKGKNDKGEETYFFKGIASTPDVDSQGEQLLANRYDLNEFKNVNYNHKSKDDANANLGLIVEHKFVKDGLLIKGELFPDMPMTAGVVNWMKALGKRGKKMQLSVEGQVIQRGHTNKNHPLYKKILKAKLTGVALTNNPINGNTFAELIEKGYTDNNWKFEEEDEKLLEDIDKAMTAGHVTGTDTNNKETTVEALKKEDLEGAGKCSCGKEDCKICSANKKVLSKSSIIESIFNYFYPIDFQKASKIYQLVEKISQMENKQPTNETLQKAYDILDLAEKTEADQSVIAKSMESAKKLISGMKKLEKNEVVTVLTDAGFAVELIEKAYNEVNHVVLNDSAADPKFGEAIQKSFDSIRESVESIQTNTDTKLSAVGAILKAQNDMIELLMVSNEELKKSNEELSANVLSIKETTDKISKLPFNTKRSLNSASVERFEKAEDGGEIYNIDDKNQRRALVNKLVNISGFQSQSHHETGKYDERLYKAAMEIEMVGGVSDNSVVPYIKDVHKISVITNESK